jgi:hypothetical protein
LIMAVNAELPARSVNEKSFTGSYGRLA